MGWHSRPATEFFANRFSHCDYITSWFNEGYEDTKLVYALRAWPAYLYVKICTTILNPNLDTA